MSTFRAIVSITLALILAPSVFAASACDPTNASGNYPSCYISVTTPSGTSAVWINVMAWGGGSTLTVARCTSSDCSSTAKALVNQTKTIHGTNKYVVGTCDTVSASTTYNYLVTFNTSFSAPAVTTWSGSLAPNYNQQMVGFETGTDNDFNDLVVTFSSFMNSTDKCPGS